MMKTIRFRAMGCQMNATVFSDSAAAVKQLEQVPAWFEEWEQVLSRFREDSELSCFNRGEIKLAESSQVFKEVLGTAQQVESESGGLVSPLVLGAMQRIGYNKSFEKIGETLSVPAFAYGEAADNIFEDNPAAGETGTVRYDFGGVAKGWAARQAVRRLGRYAPALVNAGGDIAISALMPNGEGWIINVTDPFSPEDHLAVLRVGRGGVATSGTDYRNWFQNGQKRHHIIDPRSGESAETDLISVTVVAQDVVQAEMAAKVVLILGGEQGLAWLAERPQFVALLVYEDQDVQTTPGLQAYLRSSRW